MTQQLGTTFLAQLPADGAARAGGDRGPPIVLSAPDSPISQALPVALQAMIAKTNEPPIRATPLFVPTLRYALSHKDLLFKVNA